MIRIAIVNVTESHVRQSRTHLHSRRINGASIRAPLKVMCEIWRQYQSKTTPL